MNFDRAVAIATWPETSDTVDIRLFCRQAELLFGAEIFDAKITALH